MEFVRTLCVSHFQREHGLQTQHMHKAKGLYGTCYQGLVRSTFIIHEGHNYNCMQDLVPRLPGNKFKMTVTA